MSELVLPDLRTELNPEQYLAATTIDGPLLVLAGAGSGKTRVLVFRIAHILAQGKAKPWQILAVTFTNKAAKEMRHRLETLVGPMVHQAWIGTFHSLSARMLRIEGHRLGYNPNFTIYDADDSKRLLKSIMTDMEIETSGHAVNADRVGHAIEQAKNAGQNPKAFAESVSQFDPPAKRIAKAVYFRYQQTLRQANAMDFGDLVRLATELLKHHPEAFERFGRRFRYIMVDEFQDTNKIQYDFLKALTREHHNLMVVGDDDQSIYRWRGAEVAHILGFGKEHPDAEVIRLEQNYRSSGHILLAANAVIARNRQRHPKTLFTEAPDGAKVGLAILSDGQAEAQLVASEIRKRIHDGREPHEHAILFRMNAQSRLFEEALRRARLPYRLVGGTGFFERKEVKDILAYMRLLVNPSSRQDFARVVNTPTRGIGAKSLERLRASSDTQEGLDMLQVSDDILGQTGLRKAAITKLRSFARLMSELRELAQNASAVEVVQELIKRIEYEMYLEKSDPTTSDDRMANIAELVTSIAEHESRTFTEVLIPSEGNADEQNIHTGGLGLTGAKTPLEAYLDEAALAAGERTSGDQDGVQLLTLHAAKGLEFPVVFLVGVEEKTFPSARAVESDEPGAIEEERRLCYVGMTRAMEELHITLARRRVIFGRTELRTASRFVGELPDKAVRALGVPSSRQNSTWDDEDELFDDSDEAEFGDPNPFEDFDDTSFSGASGSPRAGDRAHHNTFGPGRVLSVSGSGGKARLQIEFEDGSTRTVIAKYLTF